MHAPAVPCHFAPPTLQPGIRTRSSPYGHTPPQVGYVSILNLPMRRAEAKRKLEATTGAFAQAG